MPEQEVKVEHKHHHYSRRDSGGFVWFLGAIGAAVYYLQQAQTFGEGALGILKALVWPAILVFKLLGL